MVSIKEVAVRAGVSVGTVSNVLNRPDVVAATTRRKVEAAIADLGYVRNESARQLRAGRSRTIGLVVLDVANPFFTDVAQGVEATAEEADAVVTLCNSANDPLRQSRHLDLLAQQRVRGVLITPVETNDPAIDHLVEIGGISCEPCTCTWLTIRSSRTSTRSCVTCAPPRRRSGS